MVEAVSAISATSQGPLAKIESSKSASAAPATGFADMLKSTAVATVDSVKKSESTAMSAMQGGAGLQDVVSATIRAELAVETAVSVRNKMIEAYQEIMRMQI